MEDSKTGDIKLEWKDLTIISKIIFIIFLIVILPVIICCFCFIILLVLIEYCLNPKFRQVIKK